MSERRLSVTVRGTNGRAFSFTCYADPGWIPEWQSAGIDVAEVINTVPEWLVRLSPAWCVRAWIAAQDVIQFRNPWAGGPPPTVCPGCVHRSEDGRCTRFGLATAHYGACNYRRTLPPAGGTEG